MSVFHFGVLIKTHRYHLAEALMYVASDGLDRRRAAGAQRRGDGATSAWMKLHESPGLQEVTSPLLICSSPEEGQRSQRLFQRHPETRLKFIDNIDWKDQPVFFSPCFLSFLYLLVFSGYSSPFVSSLDSFLSPPPTPPTPSHWGSEERHSGASPCSELQTQQARLTLQGQRDDEGGGARQQQ